MNAVAFEGVGFDRDGRRVLDIPSLVITEGARTAVLGPNGSGKSTLLRLIAGLERPTRGRVQVAGAPAAGGPGGRVALAMQQAVFLRGSVADNLRLGLALRGVPRAEQWDRSRGAARDCGVEGLLDRPARALSVGEAQRVNVARALVLGAPVLLLDEPLAGVDRTGRRALLEELPPLLRTTGATVLVVTHDRDEAFRLADDLVVLIDGRVRAHGPKRDVLAAPADAEAAEQLGYLVLEGPDGRVAVHAEDLVLDGDGVPLACRVRGMVDLGTHHALLGRIGTVHVEVPVPSGLVPPAEGLVTVRARRAVPLGAERL